MHYTLISSLALAGSALAQSSQQGSTTHVILVGGENGAPKFEPSVLTASVGQTVEFLFLPTNHSVAEAAFDSPCVPKEQSTSAKGKVGFFSGFQPVENGTNNNGQATANADNVALKTFSIKVASTDPIWFYDAAAQNCQQGMVGVINPKNSTGETLEAFQAAAAKAPSNVAPAKVSGGTEKNQAVKQAQVKGVAKPSGAAQATSTGIAKVAAEVSSTLTAPLCTGTPTGNSSTVLAADFSGTVAPALNNAATPATSAAADSAAATGPSTMAGGVVMMPSATPAAASGGVGSDSSASGAASGVAGVASPSGVGISLSGANSTSTNGTNGIVTGSAVGGPQNPLASAASLSILVIMASSFALFA